MREGARCPGRWLGVGAVPAVAAVGTDELAVQPEHLHAADLALLARGLRRLGGLLLLCLLFAHRKKSIRAVYGRVARLTPASSAGARIVSGCRTDPEKIGDAGGAQRLERAVGEDFLGLTERGGESPGENLQRREALLKLGDLDG